jgi:hypothetical protein
MRTQFLLIPLFVAFTAVSAATTITPPSAGITSVRSEPDSGASESPALTDEEKQADQAMWENAKELGGIIDRHRKELNLPGVVGIYQVGADAYHSWIRVMVKELTPQLDHQLPNELEGVWIQVVDQTRYDEETPPLSRSWTIIPTGS